MIRKVAMVLLAALSMNGYADDGLCSQGLVQLRNMSGDDYDKFFANAKIAQEQRVQVIARALAQACQNSSDIIFRGNISLNLKKTKDFSQYSESTTEWAFECVGSESGYAKMTIALMHSPRRSGDVMGWRKDDYSSGQCFNLVTPAEEATLHQKFGHTKLD